MSLRNVWLRTGARAAPWGKVRHRLWPAGPVSTRDETAARGDIVPVSPARKPAAPVGRPMAGTRASAGGVCGGAFPRCTGFRRDLRLLSKSTSALEQDTEIEEGA